MKCRSWFVLLVVLFVRCSLRLRYRIEVKGLEKVGSCRGALFLPNHSAEIDPIILAAILWPKFRIRPLVVEHFYHLKGFRWCMDLVGALPLPSMDEKANKWRGKRVAQQLAHMLSELKQGENFLFYPSGRLKVTGVELLGGASLLHKVLQAAPETPLVLVRTTGLWGSQFSRALTGSSPDFGLVLLACAKLLLKNGIFFAPRRDVTVEVERAGSAFPVQGSRLEVNQYLEGWYNRYPEAGAEPLKLISSCFWKVELLTPMKQEAVVASSLQPVSEAIVGEVRLFLGKLCGRKEIERTAHLSHDLGLDSLDVAQVYVFLDERYGVAHLTPGELQTVEDVLQAAASAGKEVHNASEEPITPFHWPHEKRPLPQLPEAATLPEAFIESAKRLGSKVACVDTLAGPLSYSDLLLRALVLTQKFQKLPGQHVGILLPSSSAAYLTVLAVLLAGKIPVMLNWTVGSKALNHSASLVEFSCVLTSMKFLDRLETEELGTIEDKLFFLEESAESVTWKERLRALWWRCKTRQSLLKALNLNTLQPKDTAVILFTSGTESLPKGVPLSHENLLANQRAALQAVPFSATDRFYGVLPPFHSFGFSITGLYPLLAGIPVCYAPDPTDAHGLARDIERFAITVFVCAPSFIKALFRVAKPHQLTSLRFIVSGAEKTPSELFEYVQTHLPHVQLLEGYGITECSPVVTIDRVNQPHQGVGAPLPGLHLLILNSETHESVPQGQEGEVCIAGRSLFNGYLGSPKHPFLTVQGTRYYLSGDRGFLDVEGCLHLTGRLKRFVKIGGEMVGLNGLEEELARLSQAKQWGTASQEGPAVALSVRAQESDKPQLVVFATFPLTKETVNLALKESGWGRIVKVAHVEVLSQIPLTGTGKTNYRYLDEFPLGRVE